MVVPPASSVAAPGSTGLKITDVTNPTGLGLQVHPTPGDFSDYTSAGTYDSAVLVGPEGAGSSFTRFHLERAASVGPGPGYGRHAIYCKSPDITCVDWYVRMDPSVADAGQVFSVRYAGFSATRFDVSGLYVAALFDDDPAHRAGSVSFVDGTGVFAGEDAIFVDGKIAYAVTIDTVAFFGPTDIVLHVDAGSVAPSSVICRNVTINGNPVSAANFEGLPADRLTVE